MLRAGDCPRSIFIEFREPSKFLLEFRSVKFDGFHFGGIALGKVGWVGVVGAGDFDDFG